MRLFQLLSICVFIFASLPSLYGQDGANSPTPAKPKWYERLSLKGYTQFRYSKLLDNNRNLRVDTDRSIGDKTGFLLRRARIVLSGDVHDHVYIYFQPDFAVSVSGASEANHFAQLRDLYTDVSIDSDKEFRFRLGQSKVPYGFENLQSSQNRAPLERADAINSGAPNERDIGAFFYWAPKEIRARFKYLVDEGLKGSGDYGVFGFGAYGGQSANRSEANNNRHVVAHLTYPFDVSGQIIQPGFAAYKGRYVTTQTNGINADAEYRDERLGAYLVVYPQPIGLQFEYTIGHGPNLNAERTRVTDQPLRGGYAMINSRIESLKLFPYVRYQRYDGGKKLESNAPEQNLREWNIGLEWLPVKALEVTAELAIMDRTSTDSPYRNEKGEVGRLQVQWNY